MNRMPNWEIFYTVYRDFWRKDSDPSSALASTIENWMHDQKAAKETVSVREITGLLAAIEAWESDGGRDWLDLRARLKQAAVDAM